MKHVISSFAWINMVLILTFLCGCGKIQNVYANAGSSYTSITSIDNLAFAIPLSFSNAATAITEIKDGEEYSSNISYSYKNGVDEYIYFNMNEFIILAQKGTNFHFHNASEKEECLNQSSVLNTWFAPAGKSLHFEEMEKNGVYKIIAEVNGEVVITKDLYGDYIGKLAVIEDENEEWSVFIGTTGKTMDDLSKNQEQVITTIAKSMELRENVEKPVTEYDVVVNQSLKDMNSPSEATATESDVAFEQEVSNDPEEILESEKQDSNSNGHTGMNRSNQLARIRKIGKAYPSDEFSMLLPGQAGILSALSDNGIIETPIVRINHIYTGNEAINKIKTLLDRNTDYKYFEAPEGYAWNVAEYDISYENCSGTPYLNIKLVGLDGNPLVYRGIKCSQRTHDANYSVIADGRNTYGCLCYYAVPNGCKEYALKCGDLDISENNPTGAAYYMIHLP